VNFTNLTKFIPWKLSAMKRVKLKEWKKLKPEGELLPWIQHFPKTNLILRILDTKSLFQKKNQLLLQIRKKKIRNRTNKVINQRTPTKEVKNNTMLSQLIKKMKKMRKKTEIKRMINSVGTPKKPTSTNKIKIMKVKLKKSISKRKVKRKISKTTRKTKSTKSRSNLEKTLLKKIKSKMMKTDTRKIQTRNINNMDNADPKGLIMKMYQKVEMTIEDLQEVV